MHAKRRGCTATTSENMDHCCFHRHNSSVIRRPGVFNVWGCRYQIIDVGLLAVAISSLLAFPFCLLCHQMGLMQACLFLSSAAGGSNGVSKRVTKKKTLREKKTARRRCLVPGKSNRCSPHGVRESQLRTVGMIAWPQKEEAILKCVSFSHHHTSDTRTFINTCILHSVGFLREHTQRRRHHESKTGSKRVEDNFLKTTAVV